MESKYFIFAKEEFKVKDKSPRKCCLQESELSDKATKQFANRLWFVNAIGG